MILRDTTLPDRTFLSVGLKPLQSQPKFDRLRREPEPVTEVITFALPDTPQLRGFDAVAIRFHQPPYRRERSAKVAILAFLLVPRGQ